VTDPPLPIDIDGIDQPFPDDGHEAIRLATLGAIQTVWVEHSRLVAALDDTNAQLATTQADLATAQQTATDQQAALDALSASVADLQAQVAALTPPPPPSPEEPA
jgi:septal ring factor EnvC (AmiA/AmiB activator)